MFSLYYPDTLGGCKRERVNDSNEHFIKRFFTGLGLGLLLFGLAFALYAHSQSNNPTPIGRGEIEYFNAPNYAENYIFNSPNIPDYEAYKVWEAKQKPKKKCEGLLPGECGGECVVFAKRYLGIGGRWGYGGSDLTSNSKPYNGAVVLFHKAHVAVQIDETETQIKIIESNYDWKGTIKTRWIDKDDPSIRGYHIFN